MSRDICEVLSVERVKAAYQATGLKPFRGRWAVWAADDAEAPCGVCAAGAVAVAAGMLPIALSVRLVAAQDLTGFVHGFDGGGVDYHRARAHGLGALVATALLGESGGGA